jgi:hypothetical protein
MIPLPGLGRRLRGLIAPLVDLAATTPGADRYRKHFPARAHLWMLLFHLLEGADSLRQTYARLATQHFPGLDLPQGLSFSQLARSSTSRDPACAERLFAALVAQAQPQGRAACREWEQVRLIDSTFLRLAAKLSPWSRHGRHAPGVRVHVGVDLAAGIPTDLVVTRPDTHDARAFDGRDLTALAGWTVVMDLGYYGHARFARLQAAGVHFLCRLHQQASWQLRGTQPVDPTPTADGDIVVADQTIDLGSPNNRSGAVLRGVRLVTSRTAEGRERCFVTDRGDLTAAEIVTLYRKRWQIELCFRWLKRQLKAVRPLGTSRAAVTLGLLMAAIVAVLVMLLLAERPPGMTAIAFARALGAVLLDTAPADTS